MKILMASSSPYVPAFSGAAKANRRLLEGLASRGHTCCALTVARAKIGARSTQDDFRRTLSSAGIECAPIAEGLTFRLHDVEVNAFENSIGMGTRLSESARRLEPDLVLVSSEDFRQTLLAAAMEAAPSRTVYLVHTASFLPAGELSVSPHPERAELVKRAHVVTMSRYLAEYIERHLGIHANVLGLNCFGAYDEGPFPAPAPLQERCVTIINPCDIKGLSLFLALARAFPEVKFAAVPGWGTSAEDLAALAAVPNVEVWCSTEDIDQFYRRTRIVVVPSLVPENWPLVVVEAALRKIPVLVSRIGGLPEAMMGNDYVLPVRAIDRVRLKGGVLRAESVPAQDPGPWIAALRELLSQPARHEAVAAAAHRTARAHLAEGGIEKAEQFLSALVGAPAPH